MRSQHDGMSLWYGTPDAPAPEGNIQIGTDIAITIGVQPIDASNRVELLYRINSGPIQTIEVRWLRNDLAHNVQYFRTLFPAFRIGDAVEYTATCGCAGRRVPTAAEAKQFPSSFHVVAAGSQHTLAPPTVQKAAMLRAESADGSNLPGSASTLNILQPEVTMPASLFMPPTGVVEPQPHPGGGVVVPPPPAGGTVVTPHPPGGVVVTPHPPGGTVVTPPPLQAGGIIVPAPPPGGTVVTPHPPGGVVVTPPLQAGGTIATPGGVVGPLGGGVIVPPPPPATGGSGTTQSVTGQIFLDHRLPASGLSLRLYNRGFGGAGTLLGVTRTDGQGGYAFSYSNDGKALNLDVRAVGPDGKEVQLAATQYNADKQMTLNLVAPASVQPLAAEYQRLSTDLSYHLGASGKLGDAREDGERQDLTLLSQASGWDPRLISLAATATKLSPTTNLSQDTLYALFRVGLPTDAQQLAWVDSQGVQKALTKAHEAGIITFTDQQIAEAKTAFDNFARPVRLATPVPGTSSNFGDFLGKQGLALAANEPTTFADLYFSHPGSGTDLWQQAQAHGLSQPKIDALRLQGKLAYLTLNNADLTDSLQQEIGGDPAQLVSKDLYKPEAWKTRLNTLAGNNDQNLQQKLIPPTYSAQGAKPADSLDAYAADLARKVRISYPTQVVGRMLANNELQLNQGKDNQNVQMFLQNAAPLGFALGRTPVESFVRDNKEKVFPGATEDQVAATKQSVKTLHRLYQITPTNESLKVLLDHGFTSAYDVVAFPYDDFITLYAHYFPSLEEAELVYRKSQQITITTHNFFSAAQAVTFNPMMFVTSASEERRLAVKNKLIKHFPTLDTLFGSLDYSECDHCHSVLSPAAYLVDLLQFLDPKPDVWQATLDYWKTQHNNAPYPFTDQASCIDFLTKWHTANPGQPDPDTQKTPFTVLTERRPDLPHLPLTCENTSTAMPYIDLVNEILEYFIANGKLSANAVYDTGNATTPELLAEPQNILPAAYDTLCKAVYPLSLPFDLWLETVRGFFDYYQMPFWKVLDVFCSSDELFTPQANPKSYNRAAIFAEYLGITPSEYAIFTSANPLTNWFALYGYKTENDALASLPSAKTLSRSLGVSYKDLIALVRTNFVNPQLNTLGILYKLGIVPEDVFRYEGLPGYQPFSSAEKVAFEARLNNMSATFSSTSVGFDARTWLNTAWQAGNFNTILVLFDPNAGGNFDQTTLRYVNGTAADNMVFLKINLFVRLWKRLGWSIEETDRALQVFIPQHASPITGTNLGPAFTTVLLYIAHLNTLVEQCKPGQNGRFQLLTLWSDLATTGELPLYARLFLTRSILQNDLVFDHPLGLYLTYFDATTKQYLPFYWDKSQPEDAKTGNVSLKSHLSSVQAALGLSMDEIGQILVDARNVSDVEKVLGAEPLSLSTLSLLYRYGLLAKALGLAVRDLIALKGLSGLDPFKPLIPDPLTQLAADYPLTQTLRFLEVVTAVKASGLTVEDLNYLLRQRFDPVGKYRSDPNAVLVLVKTLAAGIRSIQTDNAVPIAASSLTDDFLRQKLALALPSDVVETFFAMWTGTIAYSVTQNNVLPADQLNPADFAQELEIQVSYDAVRQTQQLTFHGMLFGPQKTRIEQAHTSPILAALLDQVEKQAQTFFASYLQPFLQNSDFIQIFTPLDAGLTDADKQTQMQGRRLQFAQAFLPYLQQKLRRQFVVQTMATSLSADPTLIEDLLTDASLLINPTNPAAQGQPANSLLEAFVSSADRGVSVDFFASTDGMGPASNGRVLAKTVDTTGKPNGTNSAHFEGYMEVPTNGAYRFFVVLGKNNASAEFRLTHLTDPLLRVIATADNTESSQFTELKARIPYHFAFDVQTLGGGDASLLVQGENLPKDSLARLTLYTQAAVDHVTHAHVLLAKTLQFIQTFGFSKVEVRYLLTHAADFANLNLSTLPTRAADDTPAGATALFGQFLRLAAYSSLKSGLAANTNDLVDLFAHARLSYPLSANSTQVQAALFDDLCQRVANLTRRDVATVQAVARALGFTTSVTPVGIDQIQVVAPDFVQEQGLQHLWTALQTIATPGVSMDELSRWLTPAPDFTVARDLRNTVKSHYEPESWQRIAQPIFDKLRQRQRDALVSYIMQQQGFDLPEQLFEFFLIDPGMEPVVQTSRLLLAISSVQLFIQRCLLNLESEVNPQAIKSKHWQWMKRYRVWEANRKIFLFPENWLEPEFRDDKTNLFLDLESALLQGDVSNDLAEDAFFNYLKSLEVLARLDIISMYCEEMPDPSDNTLHVIGRTHNTPHKYFYRTFAHQMWTPWAPVTTQIDGDHIVAVVWKQRLHLFWVTFMEKAQQNAMTTSNKTYQNMGNDQVNLPPKQVDVQLNWCEYFQGAWTPRQSSDFGTLDQLTNLGSDTFHSDDVFIHVAVEHTTDADGNAMEGAVNIYLSNPINQSFKVVNKHSPPQHISLSSTRPWEPYTSTSHQAAKYTATGELEVSYIESLTVDSSLSSPKIASTTKPILQQGDNYSLLFASNPPPFKLAATNETGRAGSLLSWFDSPWLISTLTRPFFYADSENTFFVEPTMTDTKIEEWDWWVIQYPWPYSHLNTDHWWRNLILQPAVPVALHPFPVETIHPGGLYQFKPTQDWATHPATILPYGDHFVGQNGGLTLVKSSAQNGLAGKGVQLAPVVPGSIATFTNSGGHVLNGGGVLHTGGLNLITPGGLTRGTLANVQVKQHIMGTRLATGNISVL